MGKRLKGRTDRQRIIDWLKDDLEYYKQNVGNETEFGTLVDDKLIKAVESRIQLLEKKEVSYKREFPEFA